MLVLFLFCTLWIKVCWMNTNKSVWYNTNKNSLKEIVSHQFYHHLLILTSFQTCVTLFCGKQKKTFWRTGFDYTMKDNSVQNNIGQHSDFLCVVQFFLLNVIFCVPQKKNRAYKINIFEWTIPWSTYINIMTHFLVKLWVTVTFSHELLWLLINNLKHFTYIKSTMWKLVLTCIWCVSHCTHKQHLKIYTEHIVILGYYIKYFLYYQP